MRAGVFGMEARRKSADGPAQNRQRHLAMRHDGPGTLSLRAVRARPSALMSPPASSTYLRRLGTWDAAMIVIGGVIGEVSVMLRREGRCGRCDRFMVLRPTAVQGRRWLAGLGRD